MTVPLAKPATALKGALLPGGRTWIERRMAELDLTVTALALRLGVSRKHLSNILNGGVPVTDEMRERLAKALGLDAILLACMLHDGVTVFRPLPTAPTHRIRILGDILEPIEGWLEDEEA